MKIFQGHQKHSFLIIAIGLFALSGCNKIIDWGKENFAQADVYAEQFIKQAQQFIRGTLVYSQFTTVASFDAIFLTDQVRMLYVDYHKKNTVMDNEQEKSMQARMINENKYFISFYVIGSQKEHLYGSSKALFTGSYDKQADMLGIKDTAWSVCLVVDNVHIRPESIRLVDLPIEYRACFANKLSQFHNAYLVRFPVKDSAGNFIFKANKRYKVALHFVSASYQVDLIWKNILYTKFE